MGNSLNFLGAFFILFSACQAQALSSPELPIIPVEECGEGLIDLREQQMIAYGDRGVDENDSCYTKVREGVYYKLCEAQILLPSGYRFLVISGWRSLEQQRTLFDRKIQTLKIQFPMMSDEEIFTEASKMVAPVSDLNGRPLDVSGHTTGGAIDVCLIDENGNLLDMGASLDEKTFGIDPGILQTDSDLIGTISKNNRNIMNLVLRSVGFVNYEKEYWHWSYGDRRWAYETKALYAIYGSISNAHPMSKEPQDQQISLERGR